MAMRAAFIFVAPEADPSQHRAEVLTPEVELVVHAVKNYADACTLAKQLVADGIIAIELCGGFGSEGVAQVTRAVAGRAAVGVVRFDHHPGLDHHSGDEYFL
ncbi:DUF6506 family protein [Niveibacterium terrae]|uniref:DUF6506 family protein n=1 Tax=Niveibacterium terrae TaxID=3373598 RepID=UPI003A8CC650